MPKKHFKGNSADHLHQSHMGCCIQGRFIWGTQQSAGHVKSPQKCPHADVRARRWPYSQHSNPFRYLRNQHMWLQFDTFCLYFSSSPTVHTPFSPPLSFGATLSDPKACEPCMVGDRVWLENQSWGACLHLLRPCPVLLLNLNRDVGSKLILEGGDMGEVTMTHDSRARSLHKWAKASKKFHEKFQVNVTQWAYMFQ